MTSTLEAVTGRHVSRETLDRLHAYEQMVRSENDRQNLVSRTTLADFWRRHILDSAQLLRLGDPSCAPWVDIGSGAGLPGIVIACFGIGPVILVEPRRLRAEFLGRVVDSLGLDAQVIQAKAQQVNGSFATITARAVASLQELLKISSHLSTGKSLFLFPKGKSAHSELLDVQKTWQGSFHVEPSITDPDSSIIVASNVRPKST